MHQVKSRSRICRFLRGAPMTGLLCFICGWLLISLLVMLGCFIYGAHVLKVSEIPPLLGNRPETIDMLEGKRDDIRPFTFWVAGDPHKDDYLRILYPENVKPAHPDFGIVLGDVVINPVRQEHQYFWHACGKWGIDSPILMVVGNHDIAESDRIRDFYRKPLSFSLRQFRESYGPDDFYFTYAGCLFIIFNDVLDRRTQTDYLKRVLEENAAGARMIFVFCHIPPRLENPVTKYNATLMPELSDLAEKYHINYVISGHFHTYLRRVVNGTVYLISGGGTGLSGRDNNVLSHGIFFNVDPVSRTVNERLMVVDDDYPKRAFYHLGYFAGVDLAIFAKTRPLAAAGYYTAGILLFIFFLIPTLRRLGRKKGEGDTRQ